MSDAAALADAVPNGEFVALDGLAHLPPLEAPGVVADLVLRALR